MPFSLIRFNLIDPTLDSQSLSDRYKAMLDMAEFADQNGFSWPRSKSTTVLTMLGARHH